MKENDCGRAHAGNKYLGLSNATHSSGEVVKRGSIYYLLSHMKQYYQYGDGLIKEKKREIRKEERKKRKEREWVDGLTEGRFTTEK